MTKQYPNRSISINIFILFLMVISAEFSFAATTTLSWSPPTENEDGSALNDLDGYIIYYGTYSDTYTQSIDVGNATTYELSGLEYNTTYYIALTAYDTSGNESNYSAEKIFPIGPGTDTTPPNITGVLASAITETSATISWTTDEAADTKVEYGTTASYGSATTLNSSEVTSHSQTISGLSASTLYHYRVLSRDSSGNLAASSDYTFTSADLPAINYYCDNDVDGYYSVSVSGTCTGSGCEPAECQTTAGNDCNDADININPSANDDNCNGIDEDCSGTPDDAYVITVTSCGTGVCSSVGQIECQDGSEVNTCTPGSPIETDEATCDDLDNDCDGEVDEDCAPAIKVSKVILTEDFSEGIPDTWSNQGNWNTDNSCRQNIQYPFVKPAAIVNSSCSATSNDLLVTDSFETPSCSSVELEFSNQYYWYSGSFEIDVSDDGGQTWTNNLYVDADDGYPSPEWKNVDISSTADSSNAQIRFKYTNSSSEGFWAIDNVWVTCQSPQVEFTGTTVTSTTRTVMITNSGNEDLTVGDVTISGADAQNFIVNKNDNCTGQTLEPTKTCTFDVDFSSSTMGSRAAILTINSDDPANPASTLTLTGTVLEQPVPQIMVNGSTDPANIKYRDNLDVTIELDPKDFNGKKADWWVLYEYRNRLYYYDNSNSKWRRGSSHYKQDTLNATGPISVRNDSRSPRGAYKYYFGVDIKMNGSKDANLYFEDSITVNVN